MSAEPDKPIDTKLSFQMNHASICGSMMTTFVLDAMTVNAAFQSVLSDNTHTSGLKPGVMVCGAISYHGRSNLLRIEGNLKINKYVREVLQPQFLSFL
ncbi:uncharacterized protein TNCV_1544451 [Trichonephila clavipes]|nr:uncharacterized protein TNCV_1544451 [Trichonephila clavipes]